ncbi:hypothetical protein MANAM107_13710 [Actinomyces capricornis]|uniref:Uncharacterized protein n=1 Tax=Actinomyces capricornis TaxID=2755559 RepID=A0ABM7UB42_9ACTO|nr:hypothetical protein MANAM107_13710 [Actinomyces capricornis]
MAPTSLAFPAIRGLLRSIAGTTDSRGLTDRRQGLTRDHEQLRIITARARAHLEPPRVREGGALFCAGRTVPRGNVGCAV